MNNGQSKIIMTYDQESAAKAGGGEYLSDGGPCVCTITEAKYIKANTGSDGIEFSVETVNGLKGNFVKVYYAKQNGQQKEPIKSGHSLLNAIMGILRIQSLTAQRGANNEYFCPELVGKKIGLFLQKVLYSKTQGGDGYKFEIAVPFNPVDRKTMREILDGKPAQTIDRMHAAYKDKDERNPVGGQPGNSGYGNYPEAQGNHPDMDDYIPF